MASSGVLLAIAILHSSLTPIIYRSWTPGAVWFLGTGLGLLLLATLNIAHIGTEPSRHPTARVVRWANWVFLVFGIAAAAAVPEPQAFAVVLCLAAQAVVARWPLPGRARDETEATPKN